MIHWKKYLILMLETHQKTQKEIASAVNVDASLVSKWCSGERKKTTPDRIKIIVDLFARTPTEKKEHLNFIFYTGKFK